MGRVVNFKRDFLLKITVDRHLTMSDVQFSDRYKPVYDNHIGVKVFRQLSADSMDELIDAIRRLNDKIDTVIPIVLKITRHNLVRVMIADLSIKGESYLITAYKILLEAEATRFRRRE